MLTLEKVFNNSRISHYLWHDKCSKVLQYIWAKRILALQLMVNVRQNFRYCMAGKNADGILGFRKLYTYYHASQSILLQESIIPHEKCHQKISQTWVCGWNHPYRASGGDISGELWGKRVDCLRHCVGLGNECFHGNFFFDVQLFVLLINCFIHLNVSIDAKFSSYQHLSWVL